MKKKKKPSIQICCSDCFERAWWFIGGERQRQPSVNGFSWAHIITCTHFHTQPCSLSLHTCIPHRLPTHPMTHTHTHTQSVLWISWELIDKKWYCRLTRMDSESIWNWSAYFALIKASALISDWQFKPCWYTGNTSVSFPSPLLIINKLGGVVFFLPTSIDFFVNLTANMEKGEMPGV